MFVSAIRSEQDKMDDLFWIGRSNLPGFVLKTLGWNLESGYEASFKYLSGLAPEKED